MNHNARGSIADQAPVARRAGVPARTKSTAARKDVLANGSSDDGAEASSPPPTGRVRLPLGQGSGKTISAGTQAPPVDTNSRAKVTRAKPPKARKPKAETVEQLRDRGDIIPADKVGRGRPKLHADRKAYKAQKERERRAKKKPAEAGK